MLCYESKSSSNEKRTGRKGKEEMKEERIKNKRGKRDS